jgi:hypothetical protein
MAGRFDGVRALAGPRLADIFPPGTFSHGRGRPPTPFRQGGNPGLYVLITGGRGCALPEGAAWASPRVHAARAVAWWQQPYRRWVVRWERLVAWFAAFLASATSHLGSHRCIVG